MFFLFAIYIIKRLKIFVCILKIQTFKNYIYQKYWPSLRVVRIMDLFCTCFCPVFAYLVMFLSSFSLIRSFPAPVFI